jgi:hypothetical protein
MNTNHNEGEENVCMPKHRKLAMKNVPSKTTIYVKKTQFYTILIF